MVARRPKPARREPRPPDKRHPDKRHPHRTTTSFRGRTLRCGWASFCCRTWLPADRGARRTKSLWSAHPLVKNSRFVLMPVYGLKTPFGRRTIVCRLHSVSNFSLIVVLTPSPNSVPSGSTIAPRPPSFSSVRIKTRNRSAVSRVRNFCGQLVSMPSSSMPPKGGLVTIASTRSLGT